MEKISAVAGPAQKTLATGLSAWYSVKNDERGLPMKNMHFKRKLPVPQQIKERYPLTPELAAVKEARDRALAEIFTG